MQVIPPISTLQVVQNIFKVLVVLTLLHGTALTNVAAIPMVPSVLGDLAVTALNAVFFESGGCIVASCFQTFGKGKANVVVGLIDMALGDICTTSTIAIISLI